MNVSAEQQKMIEQTLEAAENCRLRAKKCASLGLTVLAREYDYAATSLAQRVEWQRRALTDTTFTDGEIKK